MKDVILRALLVMCILSMKTGQGSAQTECPEGDSGPSDTGTGGVTPCTTGCNEGASGPGDSGTGGVTPCTTEECPVDCYCNDDPHMRTFDGSRYDMQQEGKFYLYKHSTQPIWVQGFFQDCGFNRAFCSCGVAVRYFNETFVVHKCTRPGGIKANVVAKFGTGTSLLVNVTFPGYKISAPGALRVLLGSRNLGIGTITVLTNPTDLNSTSGLCGKYNGYYSDDFTLRSGEIMVADALDPLKFADSWRVPLDEDLFNGYALDKLAPCVDVANTTFVPPGVVDACFLNVTPIAIIGADNTSDSTGQTGSTGQAGNGQPNGEWLNGFNYSTALSYCTEYFSASKAASACNSSLPVPVDAGPYIDNCVTDIQLTGDTSFASVALTGMLTECSFEMMAQNASNSIIEQNLCPFECSSNGVCSQGSCVCNSGWSGSSCSEAISQTPFITRIDPSDDCLPLDSGTVCYAVSIYGGPFISSVTLSANGVIYQLTNPLQRRYVQVELIYISAGMLRARIRLLKCSWSTATFAFEISVSNDGASYSSYTAVLFNP